MLKELVIPGYRGEYGYVYDTETGLYYLQTRFYDPAVGRFLNADDSDYLCASGTTLGGNLYAYCENDAVNSIDENGEWITWNYSYTYRFSLAYLNYIHNLKYDFTRGYIQGQSVERTKYMKLGYFSMSYNGCEIIAIYNALLLKGYIKKKNLSLAKIAFEAEINGAVPLYGLFGTNPYWIGSFLSSHGIRYSYVYYPQFLSKSNRGVYIFSFWNTGSIFGGIHTVAVDCAYNKIYVYNRYSNVNAGYQYDLFTKIYSGGSFIIGFKIL